jgi:hypothetical protein
MPLVSVRQSLPAVFTPHPLFLLSPGCFPDTCFWAAPLKAAPALPEKIFFDLLSFLNYNCCNEFVFLKLIFAGIISKLYL